MEFELISGGAVEPRLGVVRTGHGSFPTPAFMPVGTQAAVKTQYPDQIRRAGAGAILCNAFHLSCRPGHELVRRMGGLHEFMRWDGAIVTDSGGFQVFSLKSWRTVGDSGVRFKNPINGTEMFFSPEDVMSIQAALGSDIWMVLDQPVPHPSTFEQTREAAERTARWAARSKVAAARLSPDRVFGIVQGGVFPELRQWSAEATVEVGFPGYAIGGLSVGEGAEKMAEAVEVTNRILPVEKPRYLMGVGMVSDIIEAVRRGVDMFDCTIPTRNGRNGWIATGNGVIRIRNAKHAEDPRPLEPGCDCPACAGGFSRSYIRHLFLCRETLGPALCSAHNISFFQKIMERLRGAIRDGRFDAAASEALSASSAGETRA